MHFTGYKGQKNDGEFMFPIQLNKLATSLICPIGSMFQVQKIQEIKIREI